MRGLPVLFGLIGVGLLSGPAASVELEAKVRWTIQHSPGTNSMPMRTAEPTSPAAPNCRRWISTPGHRWVEVEIDTVRFGVITSVAAHGDLVAVSVTDGGGKTEHGWVLIYRFPFGTASPQELPVGVGPDMLTFSPLGNKLLVANEGEPECRVEGASHILVDPEGSISVIDLDHGIAYPAGTIDFAAQNGHEQELIDEGVRIYGPGATAAQDLEPEHIAVGPFGMRAWVTLQENNAVALLDLFHNPPRVIDIVRVARQGPWRPENAVGRQRRRRCEPSDAPERVRHVSARWHRGGHHRRAEPTCSPPTRAMRATTSRALQKRIG